jgi:hypothetical protein
VRPGDLPGIDTRRSAWIVFGRHGSRNESRRKHAASVVVRRERRSSRGRRVCVANHVAAPAAMLAVLARKNFSRSTVRLFVESPPPARASARVLDRIGRGHRMPDMTIASAITRARLERRWVWRTSRMSRTREALGGDDLRDRQSTALVVAWMSPPTSPFGREGRAICNRDGRPR